MTHTMLIDEGDTWALEAHRWRPYDHGSGSWYWQCGCDGTTHYLHRVIMNPGPGMVIDHINGNGLDNRRENLRIVTQSANVMNSGNYRSNTSGKRGVSWQPDREKWYAYISKDGVMRGLGRHDTYEAAVEAREAAEMGMYPEVFSVPGNWSK